jgi:hypothetical protein
MLSGLMTIVAVLPAPWCAPRSCESEADRAARLGTIAQAIHDVAAAPPPGWSWGPEELAAALLATAYEESGRFRRDVHDGTKLGDNGRARCLTQVHAQDALPRNQWRGTTGLDYDATRRCFQAAATLLALSARCVTRPELGAHQRARIVAAYGTGKTCDPTLGFARRRAELWGGVVRWL